ncbi:MAG: hypothetical protein KTR22_10135 [Flavobacteriaceae bacterium]|nr:hypothetical protein [Flavobacteriaceae bacterium]
MKRIVWNLFIIVLLLQLSGCERKPDKTPSQIYTEKTAELLNDILADGYHDCSCIELPRNESYIASMKREAPEIDMRPWIVNALQLESVAQVDSLMGHTETLLLTEDMLRHDVQLFSPGSYVGDIIVYGKDAAYQKWQERCPKGWRFLSKPFFEEGYTKAALSFNTPGGCLIMGPFLCQKEEGVWRFQ